MVISDKMFSNFLTTIGIHDIQNRQCIKIISVFILIIYQFSIVYFMVPFCHYTWQKNLKEGIIFLSLLANSIFIWCSLYIRRRKLSPFIRKVYHYRKLYKIAYNASTSMHIMLTTSVLILLMLSQIPILGAYSKPPYPRKF